MSCFFNSNLCHYSYKDDILVLDKTGRIQRFTKNGDYVEKSASIDSYLGNGFVVRNDEAILACSGIVLDDVRCDTYY